MVKIAKNGQNGPKWPSDGDNGGDDDGGDDDGGDDDFDGDNGDDQPEIKKIGKLPSSF